MFAFSLIHCPLRSVYFAVLFLSRHFVIQTICYGRLFSFGVSQFGFLSLACRVYVCLQIAGSGPGKLKGARFSPDGWVSANEVALHCQWLSPSLLMTDTGAKWPPKTSQPLSWFAAIIEHALTHHWLATAAMVHLGPQWRVRSRHAWAVWVGV